MTSDVNAHRPSSTRMSGGAEHRPPDARQVRILLLARRGSGSSAPPFRMLTVFDAHSTCAASAHGTREGKVHAGRESSFEQGLSWRSTWMPSFATLASADCDVARSFLLPIERRSAPPGS